MKKFLSALLFFNLFSVSVHAAALPATIEIEKSNSTVIVSNNNMSECNISGRLSNSVYPVCRGNGGTVLEPEYRDVPYTEWISAKIKIGESVIDGNNGKECFGTKTYIQAESSSSMLSVDAVEYIIKGIGGKSVSTKITDNGKSALITYGSDEIFFSENSGYIMVNQKNVPIKNNAYPEISDDELFIPLRALATALDVDIYWDGYTKTVTPKKSYERIAHIPTNKRKVVCIPLHIPPVYGRYIY